MNRTRPHGIVYRPRLAGGDVLVFWFVRVLGFSDS
jgi:hypothetical protein